MSSFDSPLFRTQALTGQWALQQGMRRDAASSELNQNIQQFSDLMIRKAVSDTQIASWQQEQQLNEYKYQQMLKLDQLGMSDLQVEQQRLATEAAKLTLDNEKMKSEWMRGDNDLDRQKVRAEINRFRGLTMGNTPQEKLASGYIPDPSEELGWRKARNPEELQKARDDMETTLTAVRDKDTIGVEMDRISKQLQRDMVMMRDSFSWNRLDESVKKGVMDRIKFNTQRLEQLRGISGGGLGGYSGEAAAGEVAPVAPKGVDMLRPGDIVSQIRNRARAAVSQGPQAGLAPSEPAGVGPTEALSTQQPEAPSVGRPTAAPMPAADASPFEPGTIGDTIYKSQSWSKKDSIWSAIGESPESRAVVSYVLEAAAVQLSNDKNWTKQQDTLVFDAAEQNPVVMASILLMSRRTDGSDYTDDEIRAILVAKFPQNAAQVDRIISMSKGSTARWLSQIKTDMPAQQPKQYKPITDRYSEEVFPGPILPIRQR